MSKAWVNRLGFGQIGAAAPPPCLIRTYEILRNFGIFLLSNSRTRQLYRPIAIFSPMWGESTPNGFSNFSLVSKSRPQKIFRQLSTLLHSPSPDTKERRGMEQWESCAEVPQIDLLPQCSLWYHNYHIHVLYLSIKANTKKNFSCFRFVLKNFMQHLPKKRESVFPRPPNIECMRYTSNCPHDAEYPRVKRNQLLTLSGFFQESGWHMAPLLGNCRGKDCRKSRSKLLQSCVF